MLTPYMHAWIRTLSYHTGLFGYFICFRQNNFGFRIQASLTPRLLGSVGQEGVRSARSLLLLFTRSVALRKPHLPSVRGQILLSIKTSWPLTALPAFCLLSTFTVCYRFSVSFHLDCPINVAYTFKLSK